MHRQELLVPRQRGKCIVIDCYKRLPSSGKKKNIKLFQKRIWCLKVLCKGGSFCTTHSRWHAVCKTITIRSCLIFVPTLVLYKCEYNSLANHACNNGFHQGMSAVRKWNTYFQHKFKNCMKESLLTPKWYSWNNNELPLQVLSVWAFLS